MWVDDCFYCLYVDCPNKDCPRHESKSKPSDRFKFTYFGLCRYWQESDMPKIWRKSDETDRNKNHPR